MPENDSILVLVLDQLGAVTHSTEAGWRGRKFVDGVHPEDRGAASAFLVERRGRQALRVVTPSGNGWVECIFEIPVRLEDTAPVWMLTGHYGRVLEGNLNREPEITAEPGVSRRKAGVLGGRGLARRAGAAAVAVPVEDPADETSRPLGRHNETLLRVCRLANFGLWEIDLATNRMEWSDEAYAVAGRDRLSYPIQYREDVVHLIHPADREWVLATFSHSIETRSPLHSIHRLVLPDGDSVTVEVSGEWMLDAFGQPFRMVGTVHATSASRQAEDRLKRLNDELVRANEYLSEFAYAVSHDLQEPLRTINTHSQLLQRVLDGKLDKQADDILNQLQSASQRMKTMIVDLLAYSRVLAAPEASFTSVDMSAVLLWTLMNLGGAIREAAAVVTHDPLPRVRGNDTQLIQLFQNLISNAIKYRRIEEPPRIHVWAEREASEWVFSVRDNGVGIDMQYAARIFGLFKRLHGKDYPGTGIGLGLCKRIVERHGGRIWVESGVNEGSTFRFTMPVVEPA